MIDVVDVEETLTLDDYAAYTRLAPAVQALRKNTKQAARRLEGRTVWMVNSARQGGGVAEMMPKLVMLLRQLGLQAKWAVIGPEEPEFFALTKRLHNLIHGVGRPELDADDRALYRSVSEELAQALQQHVEAGDILVAHDPQPLAVGALLKEQIDVHAIWRCHIGLDEETPATRAAWTFLQSWVHRYDRSVFSIEEYIPPFLDQAEIIHPAIDPLSHKNRELSVHKLTGILNNASMALSRHPSLTPPFETPTRRLQRNGTLAPATHPEDIGLLFRPIVTQVSRWDHLKGFAPLLRAFVRLKKTYPATAKDERHRLRLELVRLVLAGPAPDAIQDDPEALEVFEEICEMWRGLDSSLQRDVAILSLPMASRKVNALIVNVLQRCSTVVVQNSLREGFGLTVTEAMWKACPVLGSRAAGIRTQIREGVNGRLLNDQTDPDGVARTLNSMLKSKKRETWGRNGQRCVANNYLIFHQVERWMHVLETCCTT